MLGSVTITTPDGNTDKIDALTFSLYRPSSFSNLDTCRGPNPKACHRNTCVYRAKIYVLIAHEGPGGKPGSIIARVSLLSLCVPLGKR